MIKDITFILLITVALLTGCKKNTEKPDQSSQESTGEAGLTLDTLWNPPANAIHIDPANTNDTQADGSIEHPFSTFEKVGWKDGIVVALKRGTTIEAAPIRMFGSTAVNNIVLASYGTGERPIINSTADKDYAIATHWAAAGTNITVRDIVVYAPKANSCVIFRDNTSKVKILNCKFHGSVWGIRALNNVSNLYIYNTEVFDIADDGMFIKNTENIEIAHCYIHHVNTNWKPPSTPESEAGGDGIQFEACNHWKVHHNKIDRSDSGNKFCFISNNPKQNDGIFEYNYLKGPLVDGFSIYIGDGENLIVRYNHIAAPSNSPLYSHSKNLKVYYNIFEGISGPLFASVSAEVYNNLFYNMQKTAIQGGTIVARNNIFDLGSATNYRFKVSNLTEDHNLFVYGEPTTGSIIGNPKYKDVSSSDFHPMLGSDCIDNGKDVGIAKDKDGNSVPNGNNPDIGPFEYLH